MRPIVTKHDGEVITQNPSRITCRYTLANGQLLYIRFTRYRDGRGKRTGDTETLYVYTVMAIVADNKRHLRHVMRSDGNKELRRQTGKGDLEALAVAVRYIRAFAKRFIGYRCELQVHWTDEKRKRAYRYLLRYPGWGMMKGEGVEVCLGYRSPEYYEWVGYDSDNGEEMRQ